MAMVSVARATWPTGSTEWIEIDEQLRSNKKKRGALDAHEMYWLREEGRHRSHRCLRGRGRP